MSKDKIGIGFIGLGSVAEFHRLALLELPQAKLIGGYCRTENRRKEVSQTWGIKTYAGIEELLDDPEIDAVAVLSHHDYHIEHTMMALEKGKHVLVEKPVGINPQEIRAAGKAADEKGLVCMPALNYLYPPEIERAKQLIQNKELGQICHSLITFIMYHDEDFMVSRCPNAIEELYPHLVSILLYLLEKPESVYTVSSNLHYKTIQDVDQGVTLCTLPGDVPVSLIGSFAADDHTTDPWTVMVKILGTEGGFHFTWHHAVLNKPFGPMPHTFIHYRESYYWENKYFIERCILNNEKPLATMEDAALGKELMDLIHKSGKEKKVLSFRTDGQ